MYIYIWSDIIYNNKLASMSNTTEKKKHLYKKYNIIKISRAEVYLFWQVLSKHRSSLSLKQAPNELRAAVTTPYTHVKKHHPSTLASYCT